MGMAFGPDGNLYIADNQYFFNTNYKSRLLRINIRNGVPVSMDVVAEGFILANGIVWLKNHIYLTDSVISNKKDKNGKVISGVYKFSVKELHKGHPINVKRFHEGQKKDSHLAIVYRSSGKMGFGADGITVDNNNYLYNTIVEDGLVYKSHLDSKGNILSNKLFVKAGQSLSADGIIWDQQSKKLYFADFAGNTIKSVDVNGNVTTIASNVKGKRQMLNMPADIALLGNVLIVSNMNLILNVKNANKIQLPSTLVKINLKN